MATFDYFIALDGNCLNGFEGLAGVHANAHMSVREIPRHCPLGPGVAMLLRTAITQLGLSARAYHRVIRIARTIAPREPPVDELLGAYFSRYGR